MIVRPMTERDALLFAISWLRVRRRYTARATDIAALSGVPVARARKVLHALAKEGVVYQFRRYGDKSDHYWQRGPS